MLIFTTLAKTAARSHLLKISYRESGEEMMLFLLIA
jgi:hypothetical protein